ncbi:hypothetical protein BT67DRAFT_464164 [Trichocladium antarcticum]|uniref:Cell surface protein n=1 Tax=Trichocladium antarcticum TaxID=1450529 RepID=A0AAN6ZBU3_9PEZI|nr:hypothetical protein BT67DRAFT_464164 [Trichocladium antarcticum]
MLLNAFILALAITPLVAAHGKVVSVTGDAGGNGTALGIKGGVVPGTGPNSKTQVDTTIFPSTNIRTDGLGRTTGGGKNTLSLLVDAMALSGTRLPQISPGGSLAGTYRIVTADGAGPLQAVLDPTATGRFSAGIPLTVVAQIPGTKGNFVVAKAKTETETETETKTVGRGTLWQRARDVAAAAVGKRAPNVNRDFAFRFEVPAGTTCNGTLAGMTGVCLVKIANPSKAGPFGGVVPVQLAGAGDAGANGATKCGRAFTA